MAYNSKYTGAQVEGLLDKVNGPDTTPTSGSAQLITSGGVYAALEALGLISVYTGTSDPASTQGADNDIYIKV